MLVGEAPGYHEDQQGIPFVGRAGQELDETYLRLAGLSRNEVFVTNAVQCRPERNGVDVKPSAGLTRCCADNHLQEEIWTVNPETVILCGASACSLIPGIDLEMQHGFPFIVDSCAGLFSWSGTVVPMYHPAAGLHESRFMIPMLEDFERLGLYLRGKWKAPEFIVEMPLYVLLRPGVVMSSYIRPGYSSLPIDTESDEGRPWSIQFSPEPGTGFMILAEDKPVLEHFRKFILPYFKSVTLHNALHDLDILDQLGIQVHSYRDTMQELYHLGNLPQGLKAATYRTSGYRMTSYDEVVTPYSKRALEDWLSRALDHASGMRQVYRHPIGPDCPSCGKRHRVSSQTSIPHEAETVLRRVMKYVADEGDYDPWIQPKWSKGKETVRLFGRPWLWELESKVGRMPRKSIVHAPLEEAVFYGAGDADWTGRLATWLEGERKRIVEEDWKVA